ncbi:hypothetical protein [Actinacidiphila glaucinigra]|uniref:hypothetical protein n=1 Tax=Actinacidiphila glaucinigra TaxID=235986 RepID=UPI002E3408C3|nr:hypothetical protein [Actinacidiphila glaucinigra]
MRDTTAGAAVRVRRREEGDLGAYVRVLAAVRDRDGHPVDWPAVPSAGCSSRRAPGAAAALYERLRWTLPATVEQEWGPDRRVAVRAYAAPRPGA